MAELLCPKCRVAMDSFDRSGITIEHCPECGGVFLDRGELERLEMTETPPQGIGNRATTTGGAEGSAQGGAQALLGELMNLARQYKGRRHF